MENILNRFKLYNEKETPELVYEAISKAVPFKGTNLWILIFAIFIASLGLNVNSPAVVIGAMLISPLMGPIVGLGYSVAINDSALLRKSLINYGFALLVGLAASTVYFLLTPIHEAQSELLSRTQPNIYDVLIATFGGFAGILAACSTQKGNVVPGVAIATALMPPLCTAGYGLAAWNLSYLFGALYLFLINSVFIALATFLTVRYLRYPFKEFLDQKERKKSQTIITIVTLLTIIPSIYFGYDIVQKNKFTNAANEFIKNESRMNGNELWKSSVSPEKKLIELTYLGKDITDSTIAVLEKRMYTIYKLEDAELKINLGLSYLNEKKETVDNSLVSIDKAQLERFQYTLDSIDNEKRLNEQLFGELKGLYPGLNKAYIQKACLFTDTSCDDNMYLAYLNFEKRVNAEDKERINRYLEARLEGAKFEVIVQ